MLLFSTRSYFKIFFTTESFVCVASEIMEILSLKWNLSLNVLLTLLLDISFSRRKMRYSYLSTRTNATRTRVMILKLFRLGNFLTNKFTFVILRIPQKTNKLERGKVKGLQCYISVSWLPKRCTRMFKAYLHIMLVSESTSICLSRNKLPGSQSANVSPMHVWQCYICTYFIYKVAL